MRVCIVTHQLAGLAGSGGCGLAARTLVELLAAAGDTVDVLIADLAIRHPAVDVPQGVTLVPLAEVVANDGRIGMPSDAVSTAYAVYRFISGRGYEIVHCHDWLGLGFYVAMARRQGLSSATLVTHLHGGSQWRRRFDLTPPTLDGLEREALERAQIEMSDWVVSPSAYMIADYKRLGISLPRHRVIGRLLPEWLTDAAPPTQASSTRSCAPGTIDEFIFFGRQTRRKGFEVFIEALRLLPSDLQRNVVFLGPFDRVAEECSASLALRRLAHYSGSLRFLDDLDTGQAIDLLARAGRALCVMPSLAENSPAAVAECLTIGMPFLAGDIGGNSELVAPASREDCLVAPEPRSLAQALVRVVRDGMRPIAAAVDPSAIVSAWNQFLADLRAERDVTSGTVDAVGDEPLVSICLVHHERPELAKLALTALMAQTYDQIEIILVDDGSASASAVAFLDEVEAREWRFPVKVLRGQNRYLGAARNLAARHARGEYILFHDDDNIAEPNEIEIFVRAARCSGFDILTSHFWNFRPGEERELPKSRKIEYFLVGIGGAFSYFRNRFGDANALIRRSVFEDLGGFTELRGVGWEDWELFLRAWLRGFKMGVVPEPLFNYRVSAAGMLLTRDHFLYEERIYQVVADEKVALSSDLLRLSKASQQIADARAQLRATLEREPGAKEHIEILERQCDDPGLRILLSDLALDLRREGDAWALGAHDPSQRAKLTALGISDPPSLHYRCPVAVEVPLAGTGTPALLLIGWAFAGGMAVVPDLLAIDGVPYERVSYTSVDRNDVSYQFGFEAQEPIGFAMLVRPCSRPNFLRRKGVRLGTTGPRRIEALKTTPRGFTGFVDEIVYFHICGLRPPADPWEGQLSVRTSRAVVVFASRGSALFQPLSPAPATIARLSVPPDETLSLAIPDDGETRFVFE